MAIEYFPCYHSYLARLAKLSDQEVGRLFRALLTYSATGECPELTGRESVAFDFIQFDIDQAHENFDEISRKRSEAASKRWVTNECNCMQTNANAGKAKAKAKAKANNISPPTPPCAQILENLLPGYAFADELAAKIADWVAYKHERKDDYREQGMKSLLTQIQKNALKYGDNAVIDLIDLSMSNGWKGIIWDKLAEQKPKKAANYAPGERGLDADEMAAIRRMMGE